LVLTVNVEVGQVLAPGTPVATLVAADEAWVTALVRVDDLRQLQLTTDEPAGASARVIQTLADGTLLERQATVLRIGGELDTETRTAQVILSVQAPFDPAEGELPLLLGAPVAVRLPG